jgi:DNA polymerase-1
MTFPNLSATKIFALDIETFDPDLKELGPGPRRDGYICGVSIATEDKEWYFSLKHPNSKNVNKKKFFSWLRQYTNKDVILANCMYDLDYLQYENIHFSRNIYDVEYAEPLINENLFKYNLESLGQRYLNKGKLSEQLDIISKSHEWKGNGHNNIWRMTAEEVMPYGKEDARITFDVFQKQLPILRDQELMNVFNMECGLTPLLLQMRKVGVRIDLEKLDKLERKYKRIVGKLQKELNEIAGIEVNENASASIKEAFDKIGLKYNYNPPTEKDLAKGKTQGRPTFKHSELEFNPHPLPQKIIELRKYRKAYRDFIVGMRRFIIGDRIHCEFRPLKGDKYGTVSGRFSSCRPNLQNIPARDPIITKDIRGIFIPEEGHQWGRGDYSQIEFRLFAHYARGHGADEIRRKYNENPNIDYHQMCADMIGIPRKPAKNINFGVIYGMGIAKMCRTLGLSYEEGKANIDAYNKRFPFLKKTSYDVSGVANRRGYIKTIMSRRRRFPNKKLCYRALNSLCQGSAADVMKAAMFESYQAGLLDGDLVPHLTVHDELDFSFIDIKKAKQLKEIFENVIKFKIPIRFNLEAGKNWATCKEVK